MTAPVNKKTKAAEADDADLQIPIRKTSPLVFVGIGVVVLALGVMGAFTIFGKKKEPISNVDAAAAYHSAVITAEEAKAKQKAQLEHLELAAKAWAIASEKEKVAAAASAAAAAEAEAEEESRTAAKGSPGAGPAKPRGPSGNELDELNKLGSAVNSELGGP